MHLLSIFYCIIIPTTLSQSVVIDTTVHSLSNYDGTYPRLLRMSDGAWLAVFDGSSASGGHTIRISRSINHQNWTDIGTVATAPKNVDLGNGFLCELPNGRIICAFRHHDITPSKIFRIETSYSDDGGKNWKFLSSVAINDGTNGLWEPFLFIAPDGYLHCYYSREREKSQQDIVMRRSFDGGATWSEYIVVATHQGSRDGMPGVAILKDGSLICTFESFKDNQWGAFIVRSVQSVDNGQTWYNRQIVYVPQNATKKAGAPSIVSINGTLVAGFMTDEDSIQSNWPNFAGFKILLSKTAQNHTLIWQNQAINVVSPTIWWPGLSLIGNNQLLMLYDQNGPKYKFGTIHNV